MDDGFLFVVAVGRIRVRWGYGGGSAFFVVAVFEQEERNASFLERLVLLFLTH